MPGFLTAEVLSDLCSCRINCLDHPAGYFDVRDLKDNWIRVEALRLFVGEPVWTPHNRPQENHESREKYLHQFAHQQPAVAAY